MSRFLLDRGDLWCIVDVLPMGVVVGASPRRVLVPVVRWQILAVVSRLERYSVERAPTAFCTG